MKLIPGNLPPLACLLAACGVSAPVFAGKTADEIPPAHVAASASDTYPGHVATLLSENAGMDEFFRHDNAANGSTMWHTSENPKPSTPATGVPAFPAWVRFDFNEAQALGQCQIWNHNQLNLTKRGFRHSFLFVSTDGKTFEKVPFNGKDGFEVPQAGGRASEPASLTLPMPGTKVKSVILAAADTWGDKYFGLSEVRFSGPMREVSADQLRGPEKIELADFPFAFDEVRQSWTRQVKLELDAPIYEPAEVTVVCDGATRITRTDGQHPTRVVLADLPEGKVVRRADTNSFSITLKTPHFERKAEGKISPPEQWRNLDEVVIAFKTHLDIGFTHPVQNVLQQYQTGLMDKAMGVIDTFDSLPADEQFKWMLPAWAMDLVYRQQPDSNRKARIEQRIKDGHLEWHAYPYTFETDSADAETIVRSLHYGTSLSREFGRPLPRSAKLTDVPGHGWMTPTLLKNAGIPLLQIGPNLHCPTVPVPMIFWWEGPDGSRLLTMYSNKYYYGYGTSETPPADWKHSTWLALAVTLDNAGPPTREVVQAMQRRIRAAIPGVRVRIGDMDDFATRIIKEDLSDLQVVRGDFPDTWIQGIMSMPETTALHRQSTGALASLGALSTVGEAWGLPAHAGLQDLIGEAYDQAAHYSEHTWGLSGPNAVGEPPVDYGASWRRLFAAGAYKQFDREFQVHGDFARQAMAKASGGLSERMGTLARGVGHAGPRVVVFNPLPQTQSSVATVRLPDGFTTPSSVVELQTGKLVPFALEGNTLRLAARDLPAGGYRTYGVNHDQKAPPKAEPAFDNNTLETSRFRAVFDLEKGGITSLVDKTNGRELVDASRHVLGQFVHERFSHDMLKKFVRDYDPRGYHRAYDKAGMPNSTQSPYLARTPAKWTANVEQDELGHRVILSAGDTCGLAESYTMTFTFPDDVPCVDIAWSVKNKTADSIPEGGWLCFPFKTENPSFRVGRAGGSIDPAMDILPGCGRCLMSVDTGITVRAGATGSGAAVASGDLPLWSLGEPGLWKYENAPAPMKSELFANLYNNMWNTNFRPWQDGSWTVSTRVWPVEVGASEEQALFTPAWRLRQPVLAAYSEEPAGALPEVSSGLALSRPGIRVMAFCPNPDPTDPGTLLRLWEQSGVGGTVKITLPAGLKVSKAQPINLRGETTGEVVEITDGTFTLPLGAWGIGNVLLK